MASSPIIGVAWPKADYISSLEQAGARVRVLDPTASSAGAALDGCDGLLLTGGADVDPLRYGAAERHPTVDVAPERDAYEIALVHEAFARKMPLLAICRGAQVLNVAAGGTLVQDIPSELTTALRHDIDVPKDAIAHDVRVVAGTSLAALLADSSPESRDNDAKGALTPGTSIVPVNSRHHQSVKEAAPGFVVSATAPDGVIEAIERPGANLCVGVQWHPENFWRDGRFRGLFAGLVEAARRFAAR